MKNISCQIHSLILISLFSLLSLLSLLMVSSVQAKPMPYLWKGIRPLGMGGVFTAIADDHNALFYNPAGLDKIEHWGFAILNPTLEIGENGRELYQDVQDTDFDDLSAVTDLLREYVGERQHARAALFPHLVVKHFGLGLLGQANVDTQVNNMQYPEVDTSATIDLAGVAGLGFGFLEAHALRIGFGAKYIKRQKLEEVYTATQIASDNFDQIIEDDLQDGTGFGFDLGAMYTFPILLAPTIGMSIQNISGIDLGKAGEINQQINLGLGLSYEYGILSTVAGLDLMDITQQVNEKEDDLFRRMHLGIEAQIWHRLALRAGLHQGYPSAGVGLDLWVLKLDYANYAEELGAYAGQRADRRHVIQISLGW